MSVIHQIDQLFRSRGHSEYGGETVTQLEHALQTATLARASGAPVELIAASLLHDVGHLLHDLPDEAPDDGIDDCHESIGFEYLCKHFPASVCEPVRLHVPAKRYLCATDPEYLRRLSQPSRVSLRLQGGAMNKEEVSEFLASQFAHQAIQLRRWDDEAKVVGRVVPGLAEFLAFLDQCQSER